MNRALLVAAAVLGVICLAATVSVFVFAYTAALTPGNNPEEAGAAFVSFFLATVSGGGAALAAEGVTQ